MIARVRLVWGNHVYIDTTDLDRAHRLGRKLIYLRNRQRRVRTQRGSGEWRCATGRD
jgi:hypothetical protein